MLQFHVKEELERHSIRKGIVIRNGVSLSPALFTTAQLFRDAEIISEGVGRRISGQR